VQEAFERAYRERFGLTPPDVAVEFINIRVSMRAPVAGAEVAARRGAGAPPDGGPVTGARRAYFPEAGGWVEATVYERGRLAVGRELTGPALVEEEGSTLVVGPSARARVTDTGNLVMTLPGGR